MFRLEDSSYGKVNLQTLLEVADACDVALQVRFVPYSSFLQNTRDVSPESMKVTSFQDELRDDPQVRLEADPAVDKFKISR